MLLSSNKKATVYYKMQQRKVLQKICSEKKLLLGQYFNAITNIKKIVQQTIQYIVALRAANIYELTVIVE